MAVNVVLILIIAALVYASVREFSGSWAWFAAVFVALLPVFAHESPLLTLAALIVIVSVIEFVLHPTRNWTILLGVALGVAQFISSGSWLWYGYTLCIVALFFLISFIRDREISSYAHIRRFGVRLRTYAGLLITSGLISLVVWYLGVSIRMWFVDGVLLMNTVTAGYHAVVAQLSHSLVIVPHELADLITLSIPGLVTIAIGLLLVLMHDVPLIMHRKVTHWLTDIFSGLALLIFIVLYWFYGIGIAPIGVALCMLIVEPFRQLLTRRYSKELLIVIGHERLSFSARWLIFAGLIIWYITNSLVVYL